MIAQNVRNRCPNRYFFRKLLDAHAANNDAAMRLCKELELGFEMRLLNESASSVPRMVSKTTTGKSPETNTV